MIQIKHTPVPGFGLILIKHTDIFIDFTWAYQTTCAKLTTRVLHLAPESRLVLTTFPKLEDVLECYPKL